MADDWGKWEKDWAQIEPKAKRLNLAQAEKLMSILKARDKTLEKVEKTFNESIKIAVEEGVTGSKVADFLKNGKFAAAKKLMDEQRREVVRDINEVEVYGKECDAMGKQLDKLTDAMGKAIKSSKDKTPAREKAKKLFAEIVAKTQDIHEAAHLRFKIDPFLASFDKQYDKFLQHLIKETAEKAEKAKEKAEKLPTTIEDSKIDKVIDDLGNTKKAIVQLFKDAVAAKEKPDPKTAEERVKTATQFMTAAKKQAMGMTGLMKKFQDVIDKQKEPKKIYEKFAKIDKLFYETEAAFKSGMKAYKK